MSNVIHRASVSTSLAKALIEAAEAHAAAAGLAVATTVVDESGRLKAFSRMDGAALVATDASRKKAMTAVGFGLPTGQPWFDFIEGDPILREGVQALKDFILLGGGHALMVDGQMVGAIGIAGGHYSQDEACMRAALAVLDGD